MTDPRIEATKSKVLETAQKQMCKSGLDAVSITSISDESGVAKTTIYRHWDSLDDLLIDAFKSFEKDEKDFDSKDVTKDIANHLDHLSHCFYEAEWSKVLPDIMERSMRNDRYAKMKKDFMGDKNAPMIKRLAKAIESGELKSDTNLELLISQLLGPLMLNYFSSGKPLERENIDIIATNTLMPYLSA